MARRRNSRADRNRRSARTRLLRRTIITALIIIALLLAAVTIGWFRLISHLQSDSFRHTLCERIQSATGAEQVKMGANLHISGDIVGQRKLQVTGIGALEQAGAERIQATIQRRALLDRKLHIRKLTMEEGNIVFRTAAALLAPAKSSTGSSTASIPASAPTASAEPLDTPSSTASSAETGKGFNLDSVQLDFAECKDTNLTLRHGKRSYSLTGSNVTATPMSNGKSWTIELENGRLHTPFSYIRDANIKTATILYHRDSVDLTECRLMLTPGELRARAHYDGVTDNWSGVLELHKASVARLLKGDWQKRLTGELFGKCVLQGNRAGLQAADGQLALRNGLLEGLPFLSELSIDNTRPYRSIELEKAECILVYPYSAPERHLKDAWLLDKIDIASRGGTLIVRGHIVIAGDGALGGNLTIGIPQTIAERLPLPGKRVSQAIFNGQGEPGYAWVNLNLSGTVDSPKEDLSVRLSTLLSAAVPELAADSASEILQRLFNPAKHTEPPQTPSAPAEQQEDTHPVNTIFDGASDLINKGLRSFF